MVLSNRSIHAKTLWGGTMIGVLLLLFLLVGQPSTCRAAVIVLDPGHGGSDSGAGRDGSFAEKRFTLALAGKIASRLADRHRVELTRTSDITVNADDRAAVVNHLNADLLISLHAGGPPYCSDTQAFIFIHDDRHQVAPPEALSDSDGTNADTGPTAWSRLQHRHIPDSRKLAESLAHAIRRSDTFTEVTVTGAPLAVLMGTDNPAVLVEVGCILSNATPPLEAIEQRLDSYARVIAEAIDAALPARSP